MNRIQNTKMVDIMFQLSHGYLSKTALAEHEEEMEKGIVSSILAHLASLEQDKIECYHGTLPSAWTDGDMVFDYLILYKTDEGFTEHGFVPLVVKNGISQGCYMEWFEKCDKFRDSGSSYYEVNQLLDLVCERYREKFHKFLEEKYNVIRQYVLFF